MTIRPRDSRLLVLFSNYTYSTLPFFFGAGSGSSAKLEPTLE